MEKTLIKNIAKINSATYKECDDWKYINYLDTGNLTENKIADIVYLNLQNDAIPSRAKRKVKVGDILYSTVRPNQRHYGYIDKEYDNLIVSTGFAVIESNPVKINGKFLYYYLTLDCVVAYLQAIAENSVATYPSITPKDIEKLVIEVPVLSSQKKIADVLSVYDDLIENNNKRIELLENMAQELYKEWFVRFRFPGYEQAEFENGIPKGWERTKISEYYNTCSGGTPSRANDNYYTDGVYPWVKTGEIQDSIIIDTEEYITEEAVKKSSAKLLPAKSVAMAMYGVNIGMLAYFDTPMTCNQACCVFSDKRDFSSKHYLFYYLMSIREYLLLIGFGAAQQNLSQDLIRNIKIIMPQSDIVIKFEKSIDTIYDNIKNLILKNENLKTQRDLLLPRLMSGKLEV